MPDRLALSQFTTPVVDIPTAVALAESLIAAMPKNPPAHVKESAAEMRASSEALQQAWGARGAPGGEAKEDPRPYDKLTDVVWSGTFWRLDSLAALPVDLYPRAARAAALRDRLFSPDDRLGFVKLPYKSEWAEVKKRLDVLDNEKLGHELDELVGPEFRKEMNRSFELYGEVLGITKPAPAEATDEPLLEKLRDLTSAISAYTIAVLSTVRRKKAESLDAALSALRPIADARDAARRRASGADPGASKPATAPQDATNDAPGKAQPAGG